MVKNSRTCAQFVLFMLALTLLLSVGADPAGAQSSSASGRLEGNIVDTSGSAVPSATVTVRKASAGVSFTQQADDQGHFLFLYPAPGHYDISIEKGGFNRCMT